MSDLERERVLDNPLWSCLTTRHAHLAQGGALARRYPADFSVLAAIPDSAPENSAALHALVGVGDDIAVGGPHLPTFPEGWETDPQIRIVQMIRRHPVPLPEREATVAMLAAPDVDDMLALVELTRPGPFRRRTVELGNFLGIRREGRLLAMAGERMWIGDYREVSAVCTHPDAQGQGLARTLITHVVNRMLQLGQTPFLHVEAGNVTAIALYRALGFAERIEFALVHATRMHRTPTEDA